MRRLLALAGLVFLLATACSSATTPAAVIGSADGTIGVGEQRVLIALIDLSTSEFVASAEDEAEAILRDEDGTPLGTYDLEFVWTVPDVRGLYAAYFDIPEPGVYQLSVKAGSFNETGPVGFQAVADPVIVTVGDKAPASETRTSADFPDLSVISSDPNPDPSFYDTSVATAVTSGSPSVIVFATPALCETAACGPMLDQAKEISADFPGVDFVHVEVFEDLQVQSRLDATPVDAVDEWRLPSEPWLYVVDGDGIVVAALDGAFNNSELVDVLTGLSP